MSPDTTRSAAVLRRLDDLIASRSILEHPFYVAWTAGELSREQLAGYAESYYPHVAAFPGYLEQAAANATDAVVRAELLDNLNEELSVPTAHPELWLDFAAGLGLDRAAVAAAPATAATRGTVESFEALAAGSTAGALAALYAYEGQQPEVSRTKANGLTELYGIDDPSTLAYFEVHAEADLRHRAGERQALATCLEAGATEEEILTAAGQALDAYHGLLDGVCERIGMSC